MRVGCVEQSTILKRKRRATVANAKIRFSDEGPQNPKLLNANRRPGQPLPPTSQAGQPGEAGSDYFRNPPVSNGDLREDPMGSITPARVYTSVRMRWNPIRGLTFERLVKFLDEFHYGYFRQVGQTWEAMLRRDYQLQIAAPKRFKSVARHGFDIATIDGLSDDEKAQADEQQEFLKYFYDHCTCTEAVNFDRSGSFSLLLRQMQQSIAYYYAVHEIVWKPKEDGTLTAQFIYCPLWWFEGTRGKLRYLDSEFQAWGTEMLPTDWLITCGDGLMEVCSIVYLLKHGGLKSWVTYLDRFAHPGIIGKTRAKKGQPEWNDMVSAIREFGQEFSTVLGGTSGENPENSIELLEAAIASSSDAFDKLVEKLDRAVTQLWRGGDLGTSSGHNRQGASLQGDESEILETDDAKVLEETLHEQASKPALQWRYGDEVKALVYLKLRTTPEKDFASDIAIDTLLLEAGAELPTESTFERYNRSMAKDGEDVLKSPQATLAMKQAEMPDQPGQPPESPGFLNEAAAQLKPQDLTAFYKGHGIVKGSCGHVIRQCRCPAKMHQGENMTVTIASKCRACQKADRQKYALFQNQTFDKKAAQQLARAFQQDVEPLVKRLLEIQKIQDPAVLKNRLAAFLRDVDMVKRDLGRDSEAAQVLQKVIATSLANGMVGRRITTTK